MIPRKLSSLLLRFLGRFEISKSFPGTLRVDRCSLRCLFLIGLLLTPLWTDVKWAVAQEAESSDPTPATSSEAKTESEDVPPIPVPKSPSNSLDKLSTDAVWLPNANGELVKVPPGIAWEDVMEFLRQRLEKPPVKLPPAITNLTIKGTADDVRAVLEAEIVLQNLNEADDEEFYSIPLALHEAILRDAGEYDGPGVMFPKTEQDVTQGQSWWLRGKGKHHLKLKFSVPVKKQGATRRLQLTLPFATVSELEIDTNFPAVVVKEAAGDVDVVNVAGQPSRIRKWGLGGRIDLTWQPVVEESPVAPVLEADTDILVQPAQNDLLMVATQRINVVQGSVSEVVVRLPKYARKPHVNGGREYRSYHASTDDPQRIVVQLNGPTTGPFQLEWTVRVAANSPRKFELDGFEVEQARRQDGRIGLVPIEGLRMPVVDADHPFLSQINAAVMRSPSGQVTRAYRFFNQPFRMVVGVETVEPSFTVEPRVTLDVTANELTLEGIFSIHVLRGDLKAVEIDWPGWRADQWILDERPDEMNEESPALTEGDGGRLRMRLEDDHPDRLAVRIKARRAIPLGELIPLSLPRIASPDGAQTLLLLTDAVNISSDLTPTGETVLNVLPVEEADPLTENTVTGTPNERAYRVLPGEQAFALRATKLEQRVQLETNVALSFDGAQLHGVQKYQFDVSYERLTHVRISVPKEWQSRRLLFQLETDRSLSPEWTTGDTEKTVVANLMLPEPRIGKFTVQAVWDYPLSAESLAGQTSVEIPIFQAVDHLSRQTDLQIAADDAAKLTVTDPVWKPRAEFSGNTRWTSDGNVAAATIQLDADNNSSQPYLITAAEIRADWDREGTARCVATYRLTGWIARLGIVLPTNASLPQVFWDGQRLPAVDLQAENRPQHYTLFIRSQDAAQHDHELEVQYNLVSTQKFGVWNRWTIAAPELQQGQWLAEGHWWLQVPSDQHLFGYASSVTPHFSWHRTGLYFSRVSQVDPLFPGGDQHSISNSTGGNRYAFSQFGEIREFRYSTMSAPMILFIGASLSLVAAFLLLNVTWLRQVFTVWCAVFVLAMIGLWFRPQLEVLLQPILIGLVFPLLAIWIQSRRRQVVPPVLSFDPLMDLDETRSSILRGSYPGGDFFSDGHGSRPTAGSTHDFLKSEARSSLP